MLIFKLSGTGVEVPDPAVFDSSASSVYPHIERLVPE